MRSELKHCRAVMALVQLKLGQYHSVLEQCVPHTNIAAQQALTGIHEVSTVYKVIIKLANLTNEGFVVIL